MYKDLKVTFLGTSAASLSPRSSTSTCIIEVGETKIMVDAGIGALRQLRKTKISSDMLDAVLLTHWHFDHCAGLPALVKSRKNSSPLPVFGPEPHLQMRIFLRAIFPAVFERFSIVGDRYSLNFPDLYVETFNTFHKVSSIGWILTENPPGNRRVVVSGDTRPTEAIIKAASGADLLVYEATYLKKHYGRAIKRQHSTTSEAANLAVKSEVGGLVLTHTSSRYSKKTIRMEVEEIFPGAIIPPPLATISVESLPDKLKKSHGWAQFKILGNDVKEGSLSTCCQEADLE